MGLSETFESALDSLARNLPFATQDKGHRQEAPAKPSAIVMPPIVINARPTSLADRSRLDKFVDPRVQKLPNTTRIIEAIAPYYPDGTRVISGYLSGDQQFWKVNYHWDFLVWMIDHAVKLEIDQTHKQAFEKIKASLLTNPPNPKTGYKDSGIGSPQDKSSPDVIRARWKTMKQAKKDYWATVQASGVLEAKGARAKKSFLIPAGPVAPPGTSMHGTGYALDIAGDNQKIIDVSHKLGASLVFPEPTAKNASHVHVEFKNGVKAPR